MSTIKELGKRLAALLDEDDWGHIEPFLNESDTEIESLRQQLAECQATNGKLRSDMSLFLDSHEECEDFDGFTAQIVSIDDYHKAQEALAIPNDATALNELITERTKELSLENFTQHQHIMGLQGKNAELTAQRDAAMKDAERYRYLTSFKSEHWPLRIPRHDQFPTTNEIAAAIDAAITKGKDC